MAGGLRKETELVAPSSGLSPSTAEPRPSLLRLSGSFLRLGLSAFGGPAVLASVRRMVVDKNHWLDPEDFQDGIALSQVIPGATVMQVTAYVGLRIRGTLGAAVSFISYGFPAFVLIMVLSALYTGTRDLPTVVSAFSGLQALIVAVLVRATASFGRMYLRDWRRVVLAAASAAALWIGLSPIAVILASALLGFVILRGRLIAPFRAQERPARGLPKVVWALGGVVAGVGAVLFFFWRPLFELAEVMFGVDLFAFGGGFGSIPLMFHQVVQVHRWMEAGTFLDGIVLGQVTPGPVVITAAFVGYLRAGWLGGLVAAVSVFTPSFLILVACVPYYDRLRSSPRFQRAVGGILASFVGLLLATTFRFALQVSWTLPHIALATIALLALFLNVDILWVILVGGAVSALGFR